MSLPIWAPGIVRVPVERTKGSEPGGWDTEIPPHERSTMRDDCAGDDCPRDDRCCQVSDVPEQETTLTVTTPVPGGTVSREWVEEHAARSTCDHAAPPHTCPVNGCEHYDDDFGSAAVTPWGGPPVGHVVSRGMHADGSHWVDLQTSPGVMQRYEGKSIVASLYGAIKSLDTILAFDPKPDASPSFGSYVDEDAVREVEWLNRGDLCLVTLRDGSTRLARDAEGCCYEILEGAS